MYSSRSSTAGACGAADEMPAYTIQGHSGLTALRPVVDTFRHPAAREETPSRLTSVATAVTPPSAPGTTPAPNVLTAAVSESGH
jgi:hypothetical protein